MTEKKTETKKKKTGKKSAKKRIYQIAKELNLSHEEIISFLNENEIAVTSHMSPVDETTYNKILAEFAKEKVIVEREKSETIQREQETLRKIHILHVPVRLHLQYNLSPLSQTLSGRHIQWHIPLPHPARRRPGFYLPRGGVSL